MDPRQIPKDRREQALFARWVRQEHQRLMDSEPTLAAPKRQQILAGWQHYRPAMLGSLKAMGVETMLADVIQSRMWEADERNRKAGMPPTDALEQAERDWLMFEPESEEPAPTMDPTEVAEAEAERMAQEAQRQP